MKKKEEPIKKEVAEKKVYKRTPSTYVKKETVKKKKDAHICSKCLEEVVPLTLHWVMVTDHHGSVYEILICEKCLEHKEDYISRYETFQVLEPLFKKRVYKKKEVKEGEVPKKRVYKKKVTTDTPKKRVYKKKDA